MTISTTTTKNQHNGNASATTFAYNFKILDQSHLEVIKTNASGVDSTLSITSDYTVSGVGADSGSITYPVSGTALASGEKITIRRKQNFLQSTDLQNQGGFFAEVHETAFDKQTQFALQNQEELDRTLRGPVTDPTSSDMTLPNKDTRKGTVLAFNATSGDPEAGPKIADVSTLAAITADIATLADIEDGTDATDAIQTVAGISANVSTVAGISSNVTAVAGNATNINAVAADATDIGTVAGKATEIGRLGTADAVADMAILGTTDVVTDMNTLGTADVVADMNVLGTADVVSDLNTLGTADVVSDMNTLATSSNVTNMNTLAGISGNITTVAGISSNVTSVAGNASNINAVAADATDIGVVAGKATEIGRLGTADAVADMVILGTTDVVADMNTLGTADVVSDMNTLGTADVVSDMNTLATADIVSDMNTLATSSNVTNMDTVATNIANVNTVAGANSNVSTVATNIASVNTTASNIAGVNSFAARYRIASSAPSSDLDEGDLYFNTTTDILYYYNGSAWVQIANYTHPNHSGEVTSTADGATVIAGDVVDEANLKVSNAPTNGYFLSAQSAATGGMTWAEVDALPSQTSNSGKYLTTNGSAASWAVLDTDANTTTKGLYEHAHTIASNYSITSGNNAMTAGPITINTGVSVTVPTGSTWIIA